MQYLFNTEDKFKNMSNGDSSATKQSLCWESEEIKLKNWGKFTQYIDFQRTKNWLKSLYYNNIENKVFLVKII